MLFVFSLEICMLFFNFKLFHICIICCDRCVISCNVVSDNMSHRDLNHFIVNIVSILMFVTRHTKILCSTYIALIS